MTPELITGITAALLLIIPAITTMLIAIINAKKVDKIMKDQLPSIEEKVDGRLTLAISEIVALRVYISEKLNGKGAAAITGITEKVKNKEED